MPISIWTEDLSSDDYWEQFRTQRPGRKVRKPDKWHILRAKDRKHIKCWDCGQPAYACQHVHWNTGNQDGISFFYYCLKHAVDRGFAEGGTP